MEGSSSEMKSASFAKFSRRENKATIISRDSNLNPPKKWTETPWLEGAQTAVRSRVTLAGHFANEWNALGTWGLRYRATGSRENSRAEALTAAGHPNAYVQRTCELSIKFFTACCRGKDGVMPTIRIRLALAEIRSMAPDLLEIHPAANRCPDRLKDLEGRSVTRMQTRQGNDRAVVPWPEGWSAKRCEVLRK